MRMEGCEMRVIKRSVRSHPRVSLIRADWGVRESFHLLHYLKDQTIPREAFEVVLIEYYGAVSQAARKFESEIDTWILLEMPTDCYYHKHLMYNTGVVLSNSEILMFMDSDAMVRSTFVEAILKTFEQDPLIVYHKHLMYNTGVVLSNSEILMFMDSDAMVRSTFVEAILKTFEQDPLIVYH